MDPGFARLLWIKEEPRYPSDQRTWHLMREGTSTLCFKSLPERKLYRISTNPSSAQCKRCLKMREKHGHHDATSTANETRN